MKPAPSMSRNMMITVFGNMVPPAVALLTGPILAHALGVAGRGQVAAATAPLTLVTTLATFGIPEAVTFAVARSPGVVREAARRGTIALVLAGITAMIAVWAASGWLSGGDPQVHRLVLITSFAVIPSLLVGVQRGIASAMQLWKRVAAERTFSSVLRLLALLPFWLTDHLSPLVATVVLAGMPVMGSLAYLGLGRRFAPPDPGTSTDASTQNLLKYGGRIWIGSISGVLLSRVDQTLMTPLANSYQLGLYVVAVTVSELPLIINASVRDVTYATDASDSVDDRLTTSARVSSALCAVLGLLLGTSMPWWIPALFGGGFGGSILPAAILLVAVVGGTPGAIGGAALSARGRPGLRSISLMIACSVNIALLILLVPRGGAVGAAAATLVGNLLSSNVNLVFLSRYFGVPVRDFYGLRRSDVALLAGLSRRVFRRLRIIRTRNNE